MRVYSISNSEIRNYNANKTKNYAKIQRVPSKVENAEKVNFNKWVGKFVGKWSGGFLAFCGASAALLIAGPAGWLALATAAAAAVGGGAVGGAIGDAVTGKETDPNLMDDYDKKTDPNLKDD